MTVPRHQIRAAFTADAVTVYQAYPPEIADAALRAGRFVPPFKRERMTWIKPSFRWMMYRCGWALKPGQERVLAVDISRAGFEWALRHACLSSYDPRLHPDREAWQRGLRVSPVRVQWDPERSLRLAPLLSSAQVKFHCGRTARCRSDCPARRSTGTSTSGSSG
ncbi:hypothetical protein FHU28_003494 [Micromonospora echinospora]|uniref:DUF4291 domain-containing protein n=1 Tax=Micromonospora echinospora TaxID=1877 RepID=A0ABR6ME63_MICEC|nr:hypothetical protein [Micromonospora echinospora]